MYDPWTHIFVESTLKQSIIDYCLFLWILSRLQHSAAQQQEQPVPSTRPEPSSAKSLMDIGTRRIFNEDHDLFRQNVRRFFQEEVVPHHNE